MPRRHQNQKSRARQRLFNKQNGKCFYCERFVIMHPSYLHNTLTRDHMVAKAKGGSRQPENIVGACFLCNSLKKEMSVEEFLKIIFTKEYKKVEKRWKAYEIKRQKKLMRNNIIIEDCVPVV